MPGLNIPPRDRLGLAVLRNMPDDAFHALVNEIERSPASVPVVKNLALEETRQVFDAINSVCQVRVYHDVELEEFISDISEALRESNELTENEVPKLRERLERVLRVEALNVAAKAVSISSEHEHLFCSVRIITDARPVYMENVSDPPGAFVITHLLKLEYHEALGDLKEIYIGLGSDDIKELRTALDRAEEKAKSLRSALAASKIRFIDPQE